jgi:hypothetical protein
MIDIRRSYPIIRRQMRRVAIAVLLVAAAVFCFFFYRDNFSTHYPIKVLSAAALRSGELPWWNFADGGGQPLAGNPNTLTFYPDNLLYLVLPAHVAFNLHFIIHLVAGWFAMRALTRSKYAPWAYVLSGFALSACAFYNLVTAVALIPFALRAAERRSALCLGLAFGLLALGTEPVTILATAIAAAIVLIAECRMPNAECKTPNDLAFCILHFAFALGIALAIALPQLIAYSEIAHEVERAHGFSAQTALNASLSPLRVLEIAVGPVFPKHEQLFLSLFVGLVAVPAIFRRSRYTVIALVMLFFALGRYNPIVRAVVEALPQLRIARYPEKFAMVLIVAIIVLAAPWLELWTWRWLTFVPLVLLAPFTLPIDLFAPYRVDHVTPSEQRIVQMPLPGGELPSRADYRRRAKALDPLFGAVAGREYALLRSPDGMHSLLSRIALERWAATHNPRWLEIATMPPARIVPRVVEVRNVNEAVQRIESTSDEVAPHAFESASNARIVSYARRGQIITLDVAGPALVCLNQSYFSAWDAGGLRTMPVNLDRLGVIVPAGARHIELHFGRRRTMTVVAWIVSAIVLLAIAIAETRRARGEPAAPSSI